jgi:hypothetical protein
MDATGQPPAESIEATALSGVLHIYVALDWGEEVDLERARHLAPAELLTLARRPRTPSSISYRPLPLRFRLPPLPLQLAELGAVQAEPEVTVFDFGGLSLALRVPLELAPDALLRLAGSLSEPSQIVEAARAAIAPLFERLKPSIQEPACSELSEEYFVFQLKPGQSLTDVDRLLKASANWTAGLVRLEDEPLGADEVAEALRLRISYTPTDLFVPEWSAALLIDRECEETLQVIAFANVQLLEYRHIDNRLDDRLAGAYRLIHPLAQRRMPFWYRPGRQLRELGEMRMEAHDLYERTGNVLKLVGDQYLARVYHLLSARFHQEEWRHNIERALEVAENAYQVVSDQAAANRGETLEWIVIVLIGFEVIMAMWH